MAILDSLPGVKVTVVVDGEDLHEYQDTDMEDEENTVTKYVEAVTGANFAIKFKGSRELEYKGEYLSLEVLVDGLCIDRPLIGRERTRKGSYTYLSEGLTVRAGYMRRLRFNTLETVTEHGFGLPADLERVKNMGKIEVRLTHENKVKRTEAVYNKVVDNEGIISEKAIKGQAMTHSLGLDPVTPIASGICKTRVSSCKTTVSSCKPVEGVQNPAATFVFFYRSKTSLKELMIIPRTPSPVPLEDRPEEELNPEEMAELVRLLKAKVAVTSQVKKEVKRELEDDDDNDSRARKRARPSASAINFEINDDDTFTEVAVIHKEKEKEVIALD
ncbi:hypothetical protein M438DRAFT_342867 [Aureobasidium pullulans EXF-150]|uniref:DUF7918 domain-containing protein n=1 Tax=Aureobasidium pullulans EXF-150 TaxID=1043002 RepID=A0A074XVT8_AURPU|nr:uncharacterized protein M438DRAFT_342867 [Aureobasidium pullulans EXF-150]KEQ87734.1 hypothetical protein M438DRAFT_342867 [Aureobasidium pullulans EXF-150]